MVSQLYLRYLCGSKYVVLYVINHLKPLDLETTSSVTSVRLWVLNRGQPRTASSLSGIFTFCQISSLDLFIDFYFVIFQLFNSVVDDSAKQAALHLVGVVTYYGEHYSTFFYNTAHRQWVYFDDATVKRVRTIDHI